MNKNLIERPKEVSRVEWLTARKELLANEKRLTRQRDEIDRQRRAVSSDVLCTRRCDRLAA